MPTGNNPFFELLGSIQSTKKYWLDNPEKIKQYNPIGVNTALSQHIDSILAVNNMNIYWRAISPKMHYDYCFGTIRKMKRQFTKWAKHHKPEDLELVMEYYEVNKQKAEEYLQILTDEMVEDIRKKMDKGTI